MDAAAATCRPARSLSSGARTGDDAFRGRWRFTAYRDDILYPIAFDRAGAKAQLRVFVDAAELQAKGVAFKGDIIDSGVCLQAIFADPDDNPLILHHRYAPKE